MKRSRRILLVCHCLLNANAKVHPLASTPGVFTDAIMPHIHSGCGLFQLPCPETTYLGVNRWGMTKEQYDFPSFRAHCRNILQAPLSQLVAFQQAGYVFEGVMGMDGSPNCGVNVTCEGYTGGEIGAIDKIERQLKALRHVTGKGVFMEELIDLLQQHDIRPQLLAVQESLPTT